MALGAKGTKKGSVLSQRLREARLRADISQRKLGIEAGFDEFTASPRINQYEQGVHVPNFQTVEKLAAVLGVPTPYFYARDDRIADWILAFGRLSEKRQKQVLAAILKDA